MTTLEKAIMQEKLTKDTVDAQFCSDWLKRQIHELFDENAKFRTQVGELVATARRHPTQLNGTNYYCISVDRLNNLAVLAAPLKK